MSSPPVQIRSLYGTNGEMEVFHEYGDLPIKNFTKGAWDGVHRISGQNIVKYMLKRHRACFNCPVHCWKEVEIKKGKYSGVKTRAPEYETAGALGSLIMNSDPDALAAMEYLCNELGLDVISTGVTIAWAMEAYERGALTSSDAGGLKLEWGNADTVLSLIEMIARREGLGDLLAEGCMRASLKLGRGSEEYAMHVRGVEIPMHDPRAFKGMGLVYATSNRGADHLYGTTFRVEQGERIPDLKIYKRYDRFKEEGKGWLVAVLQNWDEVVESLGLCKFVTLPPGHVAGFYSLVTGIAKTVPGLLVDGERIFNMKRMFNIYAGLGGSEDRLPRRFLNEPLKEGGAKGETVALETMLKEYYEVRGWDENGVPKEETLKRLGLEWILKS